MQKIKNIILENQALKKLEVLKIPNQNFKIKLDELITLFLLRSPKLLKHSF